jgi:hypothetical protein
MGIREAMNGHPQATKGVVSLFVLVAVAAVSVQLFGGQRRIVTELPDVYFTDDDGKTFFAAGQDNIPPFDHNGKQAVAAYVFRCEGQEFVGYVARFTPEAHRRIVSTKKITAEDEKSGREIKKPGDKDWVTASDLKRAIPIANVKGPKGQEAVEPVEPE